MDKKHKCFFQQRKASMKKDAYGFMRGLFPFALLSVGILLGCSEPSLGGGGDRTPPTVTSAVIENAAPDQLVLTFNENVTVVGDAPYGFSIGVKVSPPPIINTRQGNGATWTFTLDGTIAASETLTLSYTGTAVKDAAGNALAGFTDKPITNNVVATPKGITITDTLAQLNKGGNHTFTAEGGTVTWTVEGKDAAENTVTLASGTVINASTGELAVDANETAATLTITATLTTDETKTYSITVTLVDANTPLVTSVTVSAADGATSVEKGQTLQFIADVEVENNASMDVTWSIDGDHAQGTMISAAGLLTVAAAETAATLTVRATSTLTTYGELTVTVTTPPAPDVYIVGDGVEDGDWQDEAGGTGSGPVMTKGDNGIYTATVGLISGGYFKFYNGTEYYSAPEQNVAPGATQTVYPSPHKNSFNWGPTESKKYTITLNVNSLTVTFVAINEGQPSVTAVIVSVHGGGAATVEKGATLQLDAAVTAVSGASEAVTWSIGENHADGTTISAAGLLTVAAVETNATLTVRATSTQAGFTDVYGELTVTVTSPPPTVNEVWLSGTMANDWIFPGAAMTKDAGVFKWEGAVSANATFRFSLEDTSSWMNDKARGERYQPAEDNTTLTSGAPALAVFAGRNDGEENAWKIAEAGYYRIVFDPSAKTVTATKLPSTVTTVIVEGPDVLVKGGKGIYTANVTGTNLYDKSVTWTVSDETSANTRFESNELFIGADETASSVKVTAASVFDPTKTGSLDVAIESETDGVTTVCIVGDGVEGGDWQNEIVGPGSGPEMAKGANGLFTARVKLISGGYFKFYNGTEYYSAPGENVAPGAAQVVYSSPDKGSNNWAPTATATYDVILDTTKIGDEQQPGVSFTVVTEGANITLTVRDAGAGLTLTKNSDDFAGGSIGTISKSGGTTIIVAATTPDYTYEWVIDGNYANKQSETSVTLQAAGLNLGSHTLTLIATKEDVPWSFDKSMTFTVAK